jgi:hypothetical protein
MNNRGAVRPIASLFLMACLLPVACANRNAGPDPKAANEAALASGGASVSPAAPGDVSSTTSSLDALPPPDTDTGAKARRSLTLTETSATVETSSNVIPSPPAKIDAPSQTGVGAAIKAVPRDVPVGNLSRSQLEAPLRDRARFEHCGIPYGTHGEIAAVIYNGAALGVDVKTQPNDRALNFCIERAVRQMTWVKELAVNKVKVSF